jgi:hypothetical protein
MKIINEDNPTLVLGGEEHEIEKLNETSKYYIDQVQDLIKFFNLMLFSPENKRRIVFVDNFHLFSYLNMSCQLPVVLARAYSVARFSKKFVCSTAFSI